MKRIWFIIIGAIVLLLISLAWIYLILYGTPKSSGDIFANLGFGGTEESENTTNPYNNLPPEETYPTLDTADNSPLRQLSLKNVVGIGYIAVQSEAGDIVKTAIRYMEEGTGHIYEIDFSNNQEKRLTNTTIPRVEEAYFSQDGSSVIFTVSDDYYTRHYVGMIPFGNSENLERTELPNNIENIQYIDSDTIAYTRTTQQTTGYTYDIPSRTETAVFTTPFLSVHLSAANGELFISNRFAPNLAGSIFVASTIRPLIAPQPGFTASVNSDYIVYSTQKDGTLIYSARKRSSNETNVLATAAIPEKCVFVSKKSLFCANPVQSISAGELKDWYQGEISSSDVFWSVDLQDGSATFTANPNELVQRPVDVTNIQLSSDASELFFINKIDNTLWQYEL